MEEFYNDQTDVFVEEMILGNDVQQDDKGIVETTEQQECAYKKIPIMEPSKVYVKKDANGQIVDIKSEYFIEDIENWQYLTEGFGDKFSHPQIKDFM